MLLIIDFSLISQAWWRKAKRRLKNEKKCFVCTMPAKKLWRLLGMCLWQQLALPFLPQWKMIGSSEFFFNFNQFIRSHCRVKVKNKLRGLKTPKGCLDSDFTEDSFSKLMEGDFPPPQLFWVWIILLDENIVYLACFSLNPFCKEKHPKKKLS